MTEQQHPITPSDDLVRQWLGKYFGCTVSGELSPSDLIALSPLKFLADQASQWGWQQRDATVPQELQERADQELDACCKWLKSIECTGLSADLRAARRPKPPSLKEQALEHLSLLETDTKTFGLGFDASTIRRALESLPEEEQ